MNDSQHTAVTDQSIRFERSFLRPRYWPTWILFGLIWCASSLPRPLSIRIGDGLGWLYQSLNKKRRRIVETNLKLCFPELSAEQRIQLRDQHYRYYGRSAIDFGLTWWASKRRLQRLIHFTGVDAFKHTLTESNVILLLPHMTGLDCGAGFASTLHPSITMMKEQSNALLNWRLWKGRTRFTPTRVIMRNQGLRPLVRAARNNIACYYMPDEDFGSDELTVFAPFFGIPTSTLITLGRMAKMANAKVVPIYPRMLPNGHYEVELAPALEGFPSGNDITDAARVNDVVEAGIRSAPAQYHWTFKWFRTRPDGEADLYE